MRKLADRLQLWLYLAGFTRFATFVGRYGTPAKPPPSLEQADVDIHDRDTLPYGLSNEGDDSEYEDVDVSELIPEVRSGPGWQLDEDPPAKLVIQGFDPTFNRVDPNTDPRDLAFPKSKLDVN